MPRISKRIFDRTAPGRGGRRVTRARSRARFGVAKAALAGFAGMLLTSATVEAAETAMASSGEAADLAYGLAAVPFFMRDMLLLRALAVAAGLVVIYLNLTGARGPNSILVLSLGVMIVVNIVRILHLLWEKRRVMFSGEERDLYLTLFREFSPVEFMKLLALGEWRAAEVGDVLAREADELQDLMLLSTGEVVIERDCREIARARDGAIIGEMSYLQGGRATATVRALRPTRYLAWPRVKLRRLLKLNPSMSVAMTSVLSLDLIRKLGGGPEAVAQNGA